MYVYGVRGHLTGVTSLLPQVPGIHVTNPTIVSSEEKQRKVMEGDSNLHTPTQQ